MLPCRVGITIQRLGCANRSGVEEGGSDATAGVTSSVEGVLGIGTMGYLDLDGAFDGIVKVRSVEDILALFASHLAVPDVHGGHTKVGSFPDPH